MNAKPNITISELGKVAFNPELSPEAGAEAAFAHILKLIDDHNEQQSKALIEAWNEALDRAAEILGALADKENEKHLALVGENKDGDKERHAAISLNAAAITLSTHKKSVD